MYLNLHLINYLIENKRETWYTYSQCSEVIMSAAILDHVSRDFHADRNEANCVCVH